MSALDICLLALIAIAVIYAVAVMIKRKKSGGGCCGDCSQCGCCKAKTVKK